MNLQQWTVGNWAARARMAATGKGSPLLTREDELLRTAEMQAYDELDPAHAPRESAGELAGRVCTTVAKYSAFEGVAMFLVDTTRSMHLAGCMGVDEMVAGEMVAEVERLAEGTSPEDRRTRAAVTIHNGPEAEGVVLLPFWSHPGEMLGALALWERETATEDAGSAEEVLRPLMGLAARLGRSIDLNRMSARLLGSERLAAWVPLNRG